MFWIDAGRVRGESADDEGEEVSAGVIVEAELV